MSLLEADALYNNPDFAVAKQKILDIVHKHSNHLSKLRPPLQSLTESYEKTVKTFGEIRGMPLFYPYVGSGMGNGAFVELADGSVKYDFISGIGVHWGHCHPKVMEASLEAAVANLTMQGHLLQNQDAVELSELLVKHSGLDHCFLSTSGAIANENALKIAFHHRTPATRLLAFDRCFLGRTLALAQVTDKPDFRIGLPPTLAVDYVPFYDWKDPAGSTERAVAVLKKHLTRYPKAHACMCFEMIQGEAGSYPGTQAFFMALIQQLKEQGIPVFVDEVQTFGRTDRLFAFQHFGLEDQVDIVTIGKLAHTCATLYSSKLRPKPGLLSQTFTASTAAIRVGKVIIKSLIEEGYIGAAGKNAQIRNHIVTRLEAIAARHPEDFEGPFGYGMMIAFTPFKGNREKVIAYAHALFKAGVIAFISGSHPTRIRFLVPAGGVTLAAIDEVAAIVEETLINRKE